MKLEKTGMQIYQIDILQNIYYFYDSIGNITEMRDDAQQTHYYSNAVIAPTGKYEYDPLYRLLKAEGRELSSLNAPDYGDFANNIPVPNPSANAMQNYTQLFVYDELGNIQSMSSQNRWTRTYNYNNSANNYLSNTQVGQDIFSYTYDSHGNMTSMPHLPSMQWDFADRLREVELNLSGDTAYYIYDSTGNRCRKVVVKGSIREERYYLEGYEVFRKFVSGDLDFERQTLHVSDDTKKFATLETKTIENATPVNPIVAEIRYQYDNHLGSACLELDQTAQIITYEEYHPFGTTSYRSGRAETEVSLKRYKYVGKERDEETGLYYYGARYYAAWLCRFVSVDALQFKYPELTPYQYAGNKPISYIDLDGLEPVMPESAMVPKSDSLDVTIPYCEYETIDFIDKSSGKYLGSYASGNIGGYSVRSIGIPDYNDLAKNNFKDIPEIHLSISESSDLVKINTDRILTDISSLVTKQFQNVTVYNSRNESKIIKEAIEKALFFVYNNESNEITSILLPTKGNHWNSAIHDVIRSNTNSSYLISENKILLEMHTHMDAPLGLTNFSEVKFDNTNSEDAEQVPLKGMSEKDLNFSNKYKIPTYAIVLFSDKNEYGNIYQTYMNKDKSETHKAVTNLTNIQNNILNFLQYAIRTNR